MTDACNYADDTTFHACDLDLKLLLLDWSIMRPLPWDGLNQTIWNWININDIFLFSKPKYETFANVGEVKIRGSKQQKRLGILIDRNFNIDEHILPRCKKQVKSSVQSLG